MPKLVQGCLIYPRIGIPDPQGRNPKPNRPFVVVTRNEEIPADGRVQCLGITREFDQMPADHCVQLKHGPTCRTGLREASAVHCGWLIEIGAENFDVGRGYIDPATLERAIERMIALDPELRIVP